MINRNKEERKPKTIRVIEAMFAMLPDEEWERISKWGVSSKRDIREKIRNIAERGVCYHSMELALMITQDELSVIDHLTPLEAYHKIMSFVDSRLFNSKEI